MIYRFIIAAAFLLSFAATAHAHLLPAEHGSFSAGFTHPIFGLDHILVMVAVGLWAFRAGGRATWFVPGAFVTMMGAGYLFALSGGSLPFVEPVILASVVALGLLIAFAVRLPVYLSAIVVGGFAVFHGHAHGAEIGEAGMLAYGAGFAVATALLHVLGIGLGLSMNRLQAVGDWMTRSMGAATAMAGAILLLG
jgi:urease accessory protein